MAIPPTYPNHILTLDSITVSRSYHITWCQYIAWCTVLASTSRFMSCSIDTKFVAARLHFKVEQVRCWKDCETTAMHVALCQCERCNSRHWNSLSILLNLQSYIMNHVIYSSHTGYTMKGAMLSCCTTVPWCTKVVFTLPVLCRVHWQWANRFCAMKSLRSLHSAEDASASDPVVLNDSHGSLHRNPELSCACGCLENCL